VTEIFSFLKKDDLLLLPIEGRVFNRRRAFDRFACGDGHLWIEQISVGHEEKKFLKDF
jgi:hypothetical protein